jgi:hypothetical protein
VTATRRTHSNNTATATAARALGLIATDVLISSPTAICHQYHVGKISVGEQHDGAAATATARRVIPGRIATNRAIGHDAVSGAIRRDLKSHHEGKTAACTASASIIVVAVARAAATAEIKSLKTIVATIERPTTQTADVRAAVASPRSIG